MDRATSILTAIAQKAGVDTAAALQASLSCREPSVIPQDGSKFSIRREFKGATVFLTGATGFVGSLVLEQLLRLTEVGRVYVLLRGKRGQSAQGRLDALLAGPLFHLVNDKPELMAKVVAVSGDLSMPALGISASDAATLAASVDFLIHSAADIRLEPPMQDTLKANYVGTWRILELAMTLPRLRSMIHVSTAYVNINKAPGSTVREAIYPLTFGEVEADGISIAEELLSMPTSEANQRSDFYRKLWGFPNTYCLGKHLTEQMVRRAQQATGLPIAIVRPSLVTGLAGDPWPGFCSNWAGPNGNGAAVAMGFFPALSAHAVRPYSPWDAVPGDLVASTIIATAAAISAGLAADFAATTGSGAWLGPAGRSAPQHGPAKHFLRGAAAAASKRQASIMAARKKGDDTSTADQSGKRISDDMTTVDETKQLPSPFVAAQPAHIPRPTLGQPPLLIVHAALTTAYPAVAREAYNTAVDFFRAHGVPRGCLLWRGAQGLPYMPTDWQEPSVTMIKFWKLYTGVKVAIVCFLLRLFGLAKPAQKLSVGYTQWRNNNDFKNDTRLLFASPMLSALHTRIVPEERRGFLLAFGPRRGETADGAGEIEHPAADLGWRQLQLNVIAGILRALTGTSVPQEPTPIPGKPGEFISHQYAHLRPRTTANS